MALDALPKKTTSRFFLASLASAPVAVEIFRDEARRQRDAKDAARYGRYRVGDADLAAIRRYAAHDAAHGPHPPATPGHNGGPETPGHKSAVERIYLRGVYRDKYDYLSRHPEAAAAAIAATTAALAAGQRTSSAAVTGSAAAAPMPPTPFKGAGMITNGGGRKIRSAYPVVKLRPTAEQTPFRD